MLYKRANVTKSSVLCLANTALVIAAVSFASLAGAWGFELIGGVLPCPLCLEQRLPYYAAIPAGLLIAYLADRAPRVAAGLLALIALAFLYNAGLGVYHAGAEWKFWPGPDTCSGGEDLRGAIGNLSKALTHNKPVRCDEAALRIFGLSLAGYSVLISAGLFVLAVATLARVKLPLSR